VSGDQLEAAYDKVSGWSRVMYNLLGLICVQER